MRYTGRLSLRPPELLASEARAFDEALEFRPHDRLVHAADERALSEPAVGTGNHVVAANKRTRRSATSSGCSTTLVWWLTTPGMSVRPSGSFTVVQTFYSCSWRAFAASIE